MDDTTVFGTGQNNYGQLGDGTTTQRNYPVVVEDGIGSPFSGVVGISACSQHSIFLKSDGSAWGVGYNAYRQLGDGTTTDRTTPVRVVQSIGGGMSNVVKVSVVDTGIPSFERWMVRSGQWVKMSPVNWETVHHQSYKSREVLDNLGPIHSVRDISAGWAHSLFLMKVRWYRSWQPVEMIWANWGTEPIRTRACPLSWFG